MKITGGLRYWPCICGELHDKYDWPHNHPRPEETLAAPNVIRDGMDALQSQVTGEIFESKRGLRATYQPSGNPDGKLYVEIGNEVQKPFKRKQASAKEIRTSMAKAQAKLDRGEVSKETYERKVITRPGPVIARKGKEKAI